MRQLILVGLLAGVGCQGVVGPLQRRSQTDPCDPIDAPWLTTDEQKMRVRDRLAYPLNSPAIGPRTYAEAPTR